MKNLKALIVSSIICIGVTLFYSCEFGRKASTSSRAATTPDSATLIAHRTINETARFVAGMEVQNKNSKLYALSQTKEWKAHARNMNQIWNAYQQNASKYLLFSQNELNEINQSSYTLFYPFGGPDFLFAYTFFPDMDTYFLIGLERTGQPIEVKHPSPQTYKLYQDAVSDVLSLSFFPTKSMNDEQENDTIDGVVPVISMLMARMQIEIIDIKNVHIDPSGRVVENAQGQAHNGMVEFSFFRADTKKVQRLYYYATDLSNDGLSHNKPLTTFIQQLDKETTTTFIKSASYLMHENAFSTIRELILKQSSNVLQDDSGIPLAYYPKATWSRALYGTFYKPVSEYAEYSQPDLRDAYQLGNPKALSFRIGFARQSNLQIFSKR